MEPGGTQLRSTAGLEQKQSTPLGLVDPDLEQTGGRHISPLVAEAVRLAHLSRELFVVDQVRSRDQPANGEVARPRCAAHAAARADEVIE